MNKIFSKSIVALSAIVALTLASCTDKYEYDAESAYVSGDQVYFSNEMSNIIETPTTENSFNVQVGRANSTGALTVPVTIVMEEGCIYTCNATQVSFAPGQSTANLTFTYDPEQVVYGTYYDISIMLNPTSGTPYGKSTYSFKAGMTEWVKMAGKAIYREDLVNAAWSVENLLLSVDIEESVVNTGMYRLVNPYGKDYPYNEPGNWDDTKDYYLLIDATDPDFVHIPRSELGADWSYGMWQAIGYADYFFEKGNSWDVIKSNRPDLFGTFKDGVITMPAGSVLFDYGGGLLVSNNSGLFAVALPGFSLKDFSLSVTYEGLFTNPGGEVFAVANVDLGADATNVKGIVMEQDADAGAVADAIAAGDLEATDLIDGKNNIPVGDLTGKLQLIVVVIDEGAVKTLETVSFEYYSGASPWRALGTGYWVDDIVVPLFTEEGKSYTYTVNIEESNETPGLYRVRNAYAPVAAYFGETGGNEDIEIHAEKADGVYILNQPIGLEFADYGPMSIETDAGYLVAKYGFNAVYAQMPDVFGTLTDGVFNFPVLEEESTSGALVNYQIWLNMGEHSYFGGRNGEFQIILPGAAPGEKARALKAAKATQFALLISDNYGNMSHVNHFKHVRRYVKKFPIFRNEDIIR